MTAIHLSISFPEINELSVTIATEVNFFHADSNQQALVEFLVHSSLAGIICVTERRALNQTSHTIHQHVWLSFNFRYKSVVSGDDSNAGNATDPFASNIA
ncbi:MAG: hypothetical protein AAF655_24220 [Bacteroidota bacterium]